MRFRAPRGRHGGGVGGIIADVFARLGKLIDDYWGGVVLAGRKLSIAATTFCTISLGG